MKLYFIRHAPTTANLSGSMVTGYENADITLASKPHDWEEKVGKYIPYSARQFIVSSPTNRCVQTSNLLFGHEPNMQNEIVGEFDCSQLGNKKFWEISQDEFEKLVPLTPWDMQNRAEAIRHFGHIHEKLCYEDMVIITHGMLIRYMYHFINHNANISAYDVINSKGFKFSNLDLLIVDLDKMKTEVHYFQKPINHK